MSAQMLPRLTDGCVTEPEQEPAAVVVERLEKSFGFRPVLRGVSFSAPAGACLALLGPNGAGKTTLLRILASLAKPSRGQVSVLGLRLPQDARELRRHVGYVGHSPLLYDELTARENLLFFARMYGLREGERRVEELLDLVGMRARAHERVGTFSRGQVQRIALARGILHEPRVLLLDEPDTGLDEEAITLLARLIAERRVAGATTLLTTHALERGLRMSDAAVVLVGGRVVYAGATEVLDAAAVAALYAKQKTRVRR